jgi:hypothetical protein
VTKEASQASCSVNPASSYLAVRVSFGINQSCIDLQLSRGAQNIPVAIEYDRRYTAGS